MRKSGFFPRLALTGILRNGQFYYPYLLTCMGTAAMFYIMLYLATDKTVEKMPGSGAMPFLLSLGCVVIAFFSIYIIFYANHFVMKRRRRELGLYNILGLEKRHIARLLCCEGLILGTTGILGGLALGILLSKLILLLLIKMLRFKVQMGFSISRIGILYTVLLFAGIFVAVLLVNLFRIHRAKPVELLSSEDVGEQEPKTKKLITAVGFVTLAAGYIIANTVKNPISALSLFFIAVLLVIVGTQCLFTAGSIAILKRLRANKRYYYQPKHFTAVSGMIYRMKQNARGLATICILCTMVLVTVSTTVCLYLGVEKSLKNMYPTDIYTNISVDNKESSDRHMTAQEAEKTVRKAVLQSGRKISGFHDQTGLSFMVNLQGDKLEMLGGNNSNNYKNAQIVYVITAKEYQRLTGKDVSLESNQVLCCSQGKRIPDVFTFNGAEWHVHGRLKSAPVKREGGNASISDFQYLVVSDAQVLEDWNRAFMKSHGNSDSQITYEMFFNLNGTDQEKIHCYKQVLSALNGAGGVSCRQAVSANFYGIYGGFLFLGLFLGVLFLLVTTLIIYYKQVSEGYQDRRRFEIMQKVGMSRKEVFQSIRSQILMVFFLPLIVAGIHVFGAFHMISKMLALFSLTDIKLFVLCTLGTIGVFALIYALVYCATARTYYKIIRTPETE